MSLSWWTGLVRRRPTLTPEQRARLERHRALAASSPDRSLEACRFVVVDVETTGLNPFRDCLLAIGAGAVIDGTIRLADSFAVVVRQDAPSTIDNILVHGINGSTQLSGRAAADALLDLFGFAGRDPLVAFHAEFDRVMIGQAARQALGTRLRNAWLDVAQLARWTNGAGHTVSRTRRAMTPLPTHG